jgi:hypothetical protein
MKMLDVGCLMLDVRILKHGNKYPGTSTSASLSAQQQVTSNLKQQFNS